MHPKFRFSRRHVKFLPVVGGILVLSSFLLTGTPAKLGYVAGSTKPINPIVKNSFPSIGQPSNTPSSSTSTSSPSPSSPIFSNFAASLASINGPSPSLPGQSTASGSIQPSRRPTPGPTPRPTPGPTPGSSGGGTVNAFLEDFDSTNYNWAQTAPHYQMIALNAWNYGWIPAIKAANPKVKVFEYKDLTSTRSDACQQSNNGANNSGLPTGVDYCWAQANHPEWFLHNSSGGLLTENGYPHQYEMDYGNAAYQRTWAQNVVQDLTSHSWDGVWMDNALTTYNAYGVSPTYPNDGATQNAQASMLSVVGPAIKNAGKIAAANVGYDTKYPAIWASWLPHLSGLMDEFTWSWDTTIDQSTADWNIFENEVKACAAANAPCWFHVGQYQQLPTSTVTFATASYLLYASGPSGLGLGSMQWGNYPQMYVSLGSPINTAHQNSNGTWERDFQNGSVIVNLSNWTGTIT